MADTTRLAELRKDMDILKEQFRLSSEKYDKGFEELRGMFSTLLMNQNQQGNGGSGMSGDHGEESVSRRRMSGDGLGYHIPTKCSRVEFPKFSGDDIRGWVYKCDQFFEVDETPSEAKVWLAAVHMEGKALQWHQMYIKTRLTRDISSWEEYVCALNDRFGTILYEDPMAELMNLKQSAMTDNDGRQSHSWNTPQGRYMEDFPSLSACISSMSKNKRRTTVDLGTPREQKPAEEVENIGPLQPEASASMSQQNDSCLPTSFGKKHLPYASKSPKHSQTYQEHGEAKRGSMLSPGTADDREQKSAKEVENIGPLQLEASASMSQQNDSCLPTSFGKKHLPYASKSPKHSQTYQEHGEAKRGSMVSPETTDEPFDICLRAARESNALKCSVNEKNKGNWVPKLQSAEENGEPKNNIEKVNDTKQSIEETGQVLRPGMVLFKHYIPIYEQVDIVKRCCELGRGPGGFYQPHFDDGRKMRLHMMCLGLDWNPQTKIYGERRQHDNAAPPDIPHEFSSLVSRVLDDSHTLIKGDPKTTNVENILPRMSPDVCIVNFYTTNGRLGLHQDRDESRESLRKGFPVVSISVGDSAEFLYGDQRDIDKADRVLLESGDVLIFGGKSRHIFHGVTTIIPKTAPAALLENAKLQPGRLNLTFRKY